MPTRSIVHNFGVPIAGHVDLDFGAIAARRTCLLNCAAGVHLHSGHVHVHIELHVADIGKLAVAIAKFDEHFVVALANRSFASNEIYRAVINVLGEEGRAGDICWAEFVPGELAGVEIATKPMINAIHLNKR